MISTSLLHSIEVHMEIAEDRYGPFASTHEALGVILEEFEELREAIQSNDAERIKRECIDLAAPVIRLAWEIENLKKISDRSKK